MCGNSTIYSYRKLKEESLPFPYSRKLKGKPGSIFLPGRNDACISVELCAHAFVWKRSSSNAHFNNADGELNKPATILYQACVLTNLNLNDALHVSNQLRQADNSTGSTH
jgi:hypothetical protein